MDAMPFSMEMHLREVAEWAKAWDLPFQPEILSDLGWIVPGKAAIFIYKTGCALGFMENLIVNPSLPAAERNDAVDAVVAAGLQGAEAVGITHLVSGTSNIKVVERALRHGFQVSRSPHARLLKRF